MKKTLKEEISRINELLSEMRFDGKSTGLFSDEETTMNELEIDESHCSSKDLDEGHCGSKGLDEDEEEELPTVRRSDRDRARRRPYSPKARFRAGLSEQGR